MIPEIQRAAPVRQPAHDDLVGPQHLLTIDAQILPGFVWPACDHQPPGDEWRDIARPAVLDGQSRQVNLLAFPHNFLTGGGRQDFGGHIEHLLEHRELVPGIFQALGRFRFLEIGQ